MYSIHYYNALRETIEEGAPHSLLMFFPLEHWRWRERGFHSGITNKRTNECRSKGWGGLKRAFGSSEGSWIAMGVRS